MGEEKRNIDDFWDISKLVPKTKRQPSAFSTSPKVSDVVIGDTVTASESASASKIDFSAYKSSVAIAEERSYEPHSLILKRVTVKPSRDRFDFYDTFRKAALVYYDYKCDKAPFAPFYSYKPQYSQMTVEQKKYYFYWRDEVRRGNYLKTDYSYIYLYAYEILNLPDKIGKAEGLSLLCDLFCAYYKDFGRIAVNFAIWIQDYCLIYELPVPYEKLSGCLFEIIGATDLKEFYLSASISSESGTGALLAYLSDYDWRRGKYASVGNTELYRSHVIGAMRKVFFRLFNESYFSGSKTARLSRQAFPGSLCTHSVKCFLEVEYLEFSSSPELRGIVTDALKYVENNLRRLASIKSRLAVKSCPDEIKLIIDRYFEAEFEKARKIKEKENAPEYEKLYSQAEDDDISLEEALKIERASWINTHRLLEGTEGYDEDEREPVSDPPSEPDTTIDEAPVTATSDDSGGDDYGLSETEIAFIRAILDGNSQLALTVCKESSLMPDSVTEHINEVFFDRLGDVIIEFDGESYVIIEDYLEDVFEWQRSIAK